MPKWFSSTLGLAVCVALCGGAACAARYFSGFGVESVWFTELRKPAWMPSVERCLQLWSVFYAAMAIALWLVWRAKGFTHEVMPYVSFGVQLLLNTGWPALFFVFHDLRAAFLESLMLWVGVLVTLIFFYRVKPWAAAWLAPYAACLGFFVALNYSLWSANA